MEAKHSCGDAASPVGTSSTDAASKSIYKTVRKRGRINKVAENEENDDTAVNRAKPKKTSDKREPSGFIAVPSDSDMDRSMKKLKVRKLNNLLLNLLAQFRYLCFDCFFE